MKTSTLVVLSLALLQIANVAWADTSTAATALTEPLRATATAPPVYKVKMATTKGDFTIEVHRDWAPAGADRFYNLVKAGFFSDLAFFRVVKGFMVQFGIHGDPKVSRAWRSATIKDDAVGKQSNKRGMVTFAMAGPDTRTSQIFINYGDNSRLDAMGFPPFGKVVGDGMKVVDAIEDMYGEGAPSGRGPAQGRLQSEGNTHLKADFPQMDYIKSGTILP